MPQERPETPLLRPLSPFSFSPAVNNKRINTEYTEYTENPLRVTEKDFFGKCYMAGWWDRQGIDAGTARPGATGTSGPEVVRRD
jgi:hypothetical protein